MITITNLTSEELIVNELRFAANETHELTVKQATEWSFKDEVAVAILNSQIQVSVFDVPIVGYIKQLRALAHANLYL